MRQLAFRFVRHAPSTAGSNFVVDPYLDYRNRLDSNWLEGLKRRKLDVDYNAIKSDFNKWWQAFAKYSMDPTKENKTDLLDNADGLTNVLKLPNRVVDLREAGPSQEQNVEVLKSDARNVAEMEEWLTAEVYNHLFSNLSSVVRQSPSYRIRPVFLDACNLSELEYPRVDEGDGIFTSLVGVSLPAQLALLMKSRFSKRNKFPINLLATGAAYKQANSKINQQTNASLLSISDQEETSISAFHSVSNVIAKLLKRLSVNFSIERTKPEDLSPFASASITFNAGSARIATVSFIGTYVSERLNIRIDDANETLKFAHLCHAEVNLSEIGESLLNK